MIQKFLKLTLVYLHQLICHINGSLDVAGGDCVSSNQWAVSSGTSVPGRVTQDGKGSGIILSDDYSKENESVTNLLQWLIEKCPHLPLNTSHLLKLSGNQSYLYDEIGSNCSQLKFEDIDITYTYPWNFIDALYFAMTVATTIGYGHIFPSTNWGKVACILYATIGIPLTMLLLSWTSSFFGERLYLLFEARLDTEKRQSRVFIALGTIFYISVGFVIFIFLPAIIFMYIENWSYLESVYYAFITLTTIGFGDFVTARRMDGHWMYIYQISVILWIMSGLGYWVMIANFITRAMKSKQIQSFAKKATDIKKLMHQVGLVEQDPKFISQHSKATFNFMMQLSNALVFPDNAHLNGSASSVESPPITPPVIPGIASLFGGQDGHGIGSILSNMASTTGRIGPQAEGLIKKTRNKSSTEEDVSEESLERTNSAKSPDCQHTHNSSDDVTAEEINVEQCKINRIPKRSFKLSPVVPLRIKSNKNNRVSPVRDISKNLLSNSPDSGFSGTGFPDMVSSEDLSKSSRENKEKLLTDSNADVKIDFSPSTNSNKLSNSNEETNVFSDCDLWKDYDEITVRL